MYKLILTIIFVFIFCFCGLAQEQKTKTEGSGIGSGRGQGDGSSNNAALQAKETEKTIITAKTNKSLMILSKPRAIYTDKARQNEVQGKVVLRITFKKNGEIGTIKIVKGLPDGLSKNAIEAAKKMKFEPQIKNGKPVTITKNIEYTFTIY